MNKLSLEILLGLHQKECVQQVKGGDFPPLLHFHETQPRVLHPALGFPAEENHRPVWGGSRTDPQD